MYQIILYLALIIIGYTNVALIFPNFDVIIDDLSIQKVVIGPWTFSPTAVIGFVETCFLIVSAITIIFYGYYTDKKGRKKIAYFGCSIWSLATIAIFFTPPYSYAYLLTFRLITALGISCLAPVGFTILGDMVTPKNRAKVLSFWSLAFTIGSLAGAVLAPAFIGGPTQYDQWRTPFLYVGIIALILTQLLLLATPPKRAARERAFQELIEYKGYEYKYQVKKSDFPVLWKRRTNLWLVINFVDTIPSGIMVYWGIVYFKQHGFDTYTSIFLYIILGISIFLGPFLFGWLGDRWYRRNSKGRLLMCILCNYLSLIPIYIAISTPFSAEALVAAAFVITMFAIGLFINGGIGPNWYSTFLDVNVPENRGTMISLALMFDAIGKGIGPFITGLFVDLQTAFLWAIVIWLISSIFWLPALFSISKDIEDVDSLMAQRSKEIASN
ncbi:MAG: MFS transporter [Candidatus Helarchaeota archaeon]|nr:MFS transporter [Candidatus Helarchaeota archaeon]